MFDYIPVWGSHDLKCSNCKHSYEDHDERSKKCKKSGCKKCRKFETRWSC